MTNKKQIIRTVLKNAWTLLRPSVREMAYTPFYWLVGGIFLAYVVISTYFLRSRNIEVDYFAYFSALFQPSAGVVVFVLLYLGWPQDLRDKLSKYYKKAHVISGLALVVITQTFHSTYLTFKMYFSSFVPFYKDTWFSDMDKALLFGKLPWGWLAPVFANWIVISFIDLCYTLWLLADFLLVLWMAFSTKKDDLRAAFFLTYYSSWILLGTIFALAYSSAGPCYYDLALPTAPNPYQDQMAFLNELDKTHPLFALDFQRRLWENSVQNMRSLLNGIAAFPSMHNSIAVLMFLVGRHFGKKMAIATFIYLLIILTGSVALGWHYLVDGIFSIIVTPILWMMSWWLVKRFELWKPVKTFKP